MWCRFSLRRPNGYSRGDSYPSLHWTPGVSCIARPPLKFALFSSNARRIRLERGEELFCIAPIWHVVDANANARTVLNYLMHFAHRPRAVKNRVGQCEGSRHKYGALPHVRASSCSNVGHKNSPRIQAGDFFFFFFSQKAACKVQQNDRLHKTSGYTPVKETLGVFISLDGGLQSPKDDRLHNVRIYPCCRDLECFFAVWRAVRKVPNNDRLSNVPIHLRCGDLACFFSFGKVSRTPEMFRGCAMYQLSLRSKDLVCIFTFQNVFRRLGFLVCRTSIPNTAVPEYIRHPVSGSDDLNTASIGRISRN